LLARCRYVVDLLDSGQLASGRPYLVLEWVDGWDLDRELGKGPLSHRRASAMISQICAALGAAHDLGFVHLDLKPQNLMLRRAEPPGVVLLDFGIARRVGQFAGRSGWIEGSPLFMAPEQLAGQHDHLGPAADIFALGVVAYLMLCGKLPFELSNASDLLEVISLRLDGARALIPLAKRAPGLRVELCGLVDSCLATDPIARHSQGAKHHERPQDSNSRDSGITGAVLPIGSTPTAGAAVSEPRFSARARR
jgi:serine/threonine protein kinase